MVGLGLVGLIGEGVLLIEGLGVGGFGVTDTGEETPGHAQAA